MLSADATVEILCSTSRSVRSVRETLEDVYQDISYWAEHEHNQWAIRVVQTPKMGESDIEKAGF